MKTEIKNEIENKRKQAIDEYVRAEIEQRRLNLLMELMQTAFLKDNSWFDRGSASVENINTGSACKNKTV